MSSPRMHSDEVAIDTALARRLVDQQCAQWSGSEITPLAASGSSHALFRLGDDLLIRMPRIEKAALQVAKEQRWLPKLAPALSLSTPIPVARGVPAEDYPFDWSIYRWLPGEPLDQDLVGRQAATGARLADFIQRLWRVDSGDGPAPGPHNGFRGAPLAPRDAATRAGIAAIGGLIDAPAALALWECSLRAPAWAGNPCWIHGDLLPSNLLQLEGELSAVIDFGCIGVGDPACDLMAAWTVLRGAGRDTFRQCLDIDDATWQRARGWALSFAAIALPYYLQTNHDLAAVARSTLDQVLA